MTLDSDLNADRLRCVDWLQKYLSVYPLDRLRADQIASLQVWPGVLILEGAIYVCSKTAHPGHILHEAAHLATAPSELRPFLSGNLESAIIFEMMHDGWRSSDLRYLYWSDASAIGWSYFAAVAAGVNPLLPFLVGFDRPSPDLCHSVRQGIGTSMGSCYSVELFYAGMLAAKGAASLAKVLQL